MESERSLLSSLQHGSIGFNAASLDHLDISISKIERFFDILIIGHGTVWHI
jgi:hypothetical protein